MKSENKSNEKNGKQLKRPEELKSHCRSLSLVKQRKLNKYKRLLKHPRNRFKIGMKKGFLWLLKNRLFTDRYDLRYLMEVVNNLFRLTKNRHENVKEKYDANTVAVINSYRNMIAVKNSFLKFVVCDSMQWAQREIKAEKGVFHPGIMAAKSIEYKVIEADVEPENVAEKIEPTSKIVEEKTDKKSKDNQETMINTATLKQRVNTKKEMFLEHPIHKPHLEGKITPAEI